MHFDSLLVSQRHPGHALYTVIRRIIIDPLPANNLALFRAYICPSHILRLGLWCQNRAAHAGSHELARRTRMHWSAAQFQVTQFQTQNARVRRVNCVCAGKRKMPNVFLLSLFYFSVAGGKARHQE
jgi:hypothetical protein